MDNIRLHQNGSIEMRTITLDDGLVFVLMKNVNGEKWIAQTRKVKSFNEIHLAENLKSAFFFKEDQD